MKKKEFLAGVLCGAVAFGGMQAAAGVMAEVSRQTVYVDGEKADMPAYAIGGSNYFKLRDVGEKVGFNVSYNAERNSVDIDTTKPYSGVTEPQAPNAQVDVSNVPEDVKPFFTGEWAAGHVPSKDAANVYSMAEGKVPVVSQQGHYSIVTKNQDGSINVPQSDERWMPVNGDVIRCDDGTNYEIRDMTLEKNPGALPVPTCDWSQFPDIGAPRFFVRHDFDGANEDYLVIVNQYETYRMRNYLYNKIGATNTLWQNGSLTKYENGNYKVSITFNIEDDVGVQIAWPWRESNMDTVFDSTLGGIYSVKAFDLYKNGKYLYTEYDIKWN